MVPDSPLKNTRQARTLRQTQLADLAHVSQKTISLAERGLVRPRLDIQERIAVILGVSRQELFPDEVGA